MDIHDYARLSPAFVLNAIEHLGFACDARILALNSYENRVYQIGLEQAEPIIAKFYRPQRWSRAQIIEEHTFSRELDEREIPVIAPMVVAGDTLFNYQGFQFSLYPRRGGHAPELDDLDTLYRLGQLLGRIHAVGKIRPFDERPALSVTEFGHHSRALVKTQAPLPQSLRAAYESVSEHVLQKVEGIMASTPAAAIRLHGDCHPGNILSRDGRLFLVDLDDARNGPAVQDLWMLLSGERGQKIAQLSNIIEGYEEFCEFDYREFRLIEALRALRMLHYCAWITKRWQDPAFPQAFPWFDSERYWAQHILELREQLAELDEPGLSVQG